MIQFVALWFLGTKVAAPLWYYLMLLIPFVLKLVCLNLDRMD